MLFEEGGLDALYRKQWALTCMVRTGALALDLPLFAPTHYAWGVTSIMLPAGVDGDKLLKVAADECGIVFAGDKIIIRAAWSASGTWAGWTGPTRWRDCTLWRTVCAPPAASARRAIIWKRHFPHIIAPLTLSRDELFLM